MWKGCLVVLGYFICVKGETVTGHPCWSPRAWRDHEICRFCFCGPDSEPNLNQSFWHFCERRLNRIWYRTIFRSTFDLIAVISFRKFIIFKKNNIDLLALPETNIATENWWLEYQFPFGVSPIFRCELSVSGRVYIFPRSLHSFNKSRCRTALWFSIIASLAISTFYTSPICCICNFYVHMHGGCWYRFRMFSFRKVCCNNH